MNESRPVTSIYIDIARFSWEVGELKTESELADWLKKFTKALVMRDPKIHPYAGALLTEADVFRKTKSQKAKESAEKRWGKSANQAENANACGRMASHEFASDGCETMLQTDQIRSDQKDIERAAQPKRERRQAEYTPSTESLGIFLLWKRSFPHDDAPKQQTCKNVTNRLKQHDRNHLVFSILKYASRVKKELAERPDNKMMTYKGSNFFGEKAYYESYLPSEAQMASQPILTQINATWASVEAEIASLDKTLPPGPAGRVVPPPATNTIENKQTPEKETV